MPDATSLHHCLQNHHQYCIALYINRPVVNLAEAGHLKCFFIQHVCCVIDLSDIIQTVRLWYPFNISLTSFYFLRACSFIKNNGFMPKT